jgi:hypothetical protein
VPEHNRPYLARRFLSQITRARFLEKLQFLAEDVFREPLEPSLAARLREFNVLRNNLLHGRLYEKWLLIGPRSGSSADIVDEEDSYKWKEMFPHTQFSPTYQFLPDEARKAFQILLDVLKYVSKQEHHYEAISTASPHFTFYLKGANFDAVRLLEQKTKTR